MQHETLKILLDCYLELNKLHTQPGERCHMLAYSIKFMEKLIKQAMEKK